MLCLFETQVASDTLKLVMIESFVRKKNVFFGGRGVGVEDFGLVVNVEN